MKFFGKLITGTFVATGIFYSTAKLTAFLKSRMTDKDNYDLFKQHIKSPQSMLKGWSKDDPSYVEGSKEYETANKSVTEYVKHVASKIKEKATDIITARKELKETKEKLAKYESETK